MVISSSHGSLQWPASDGLVRGTSEDDGAWRASRCRSRTRRVIQLLTAQRRGREGHTYYVVLLTLLDRGVCSFADLSLRPPAEEDKVG